jgi:hypothetical protein
MRRLVQLTSRAGFTALGNKLPLTVVIAIMRTVLAAIPLALLLGAVACSRNEPVDEEAENAANLDAVVAEANAAAEAVHEKADETPPAPGTNQSEPVLAQPTPGDIIPAHYQGRWGMVPADCTSTRGDAKGLMTIGDTSIKFYESTATLTERRPAKATSFSGLFAFRGEGQAWEKVMTFTRAGDMLKRADKDGSFTYRRCA